MTYLNDIIEDVRKLQSRLEQQAFQDIKEIQL